MADLLEWVDFAPCTSWCSEIYNHERAAQLEHIRLINVISTDLPCRRQVEGLLTHGAWHMVRHVLLGCLTTTSDRCPSQIQQTLTNDHNDDMYNPYNSETSFGKTDKDSILGPNETRRKLQMIPALKRDRAARSASRAASPSFSHMKSFSLDIYCRSSWSSQTALPRLFDTLSLRDTPTDVRPVHHVGRVVLTRPRQPS